MPEVEPFKPHGFTIFCDDLREEMSGQTTYVGVYGDALYVDQPVPFQLSQICMAIHLFDEPRDDVAHITLKVAMPGEELDNAVMTFDIDPDLKLLNLPDIGDELVRPRSHIVVKCGVAPMHINKYGRVRVAATWDGNFVPLGSLAIVPSPKNNGETAPTE